jgi:thiol-disulfide isomerase/thioredoxin
MRFSEDDPAPGDSVPDFDLPTLEGNRWKSADLGESGPALLVFGSYTCPVTDSAAPGLKELYFKFRDQVRFLMVNVREAHPGKSVPQPQTIEEKMAHAKQLRDFHGFEFDVAVDDIVGTLHRALSPKPNSAYLLDQAGTILFRALWANDTNRLAAALEAVVDGRPPNPSGSGGLIRPMLRLWRYVAPVLDRAGGGAWRDMWSAATPLAAIGFTAKTLGIGPKESAR